MTTKPRIVVTGMGSVSPAGVGTAALFRAFAGTETFTRTLEDPELSGLPVRVGARVRGFDPLDFMERSESRRLDASGKFLVAACEQAIRESRLFDGRFERERVGLFEATALGGITDTLAAQLEFVRRGYRGVKPSTLSRGMTGTGGALVAIRRGIRGPVLAMSCGSVSSAAALFVATTQIESGLIDAAIVVGTEAPVAAPVLALFARAGILSRAEDGARACRPFDAQRDGTVLGEGAAALVIERATSASCPLAEIAGVAMSSDADSLFAPEQGGREQARAITEAMRRAGVRASDIDFVSAHGTGTRHNDRIESRALALALGEHVQRVPISSSKAMLGHSLGATSATELVKTVLCMQHGLIPATLNLQQPDPECALDFVPLTPRRATLSTALVNNSSLGGRNTSIVVRAAA